MTEVTLDLLYSMFSQPILLNDSNPDLISSSLLVNSLPILAKDVLLAVPRVSMLFLYAMMRGDINGNDFAQTTLSSILVELYETILGAIQKPKVEAGDALELVLKSCLYWRLRILRKRQPSYNLRTLLGLKKEDVPLALRKEFEKSISSAIEVVILVDTLPSSNNNMDAFLARLQELRTGTAIVVFVSANKESYDVGVFIPAPAPDGKAHLALFDCKSRNETSPTSTAASSRKSSQDVTNQFAQASSMLERVALAGNIDCSYTYVSTHNPNPSSTSPPANVCFMARKQSQSFLSIYWDSYLVLRSLLDK